MTTTGAGRADRPGRDGAGTATHRDFRVVGRPAAATPWQLVSRVTEPVHPLP